MSKQNARIYLDATTISVVVACRDCDYWRAFAWTRVEGWAVAASHEARCHPESEQARDALRKALESARDTPTTPV